MSLRRETGGNASGDGEQAASHANHDVERLLRVATDETLPEPSPDLIHRTIARVRRLILFGDLLRLATLEGLWRRSSKRKDDAESANQRHNS